MKRQKLISTFLFLSICMSLSAQQFITIGVNEGLSDSYVSCIEQDHLGYMWFTTLNGADKFDGYKFTSYSLTAFGLNFNSFSYVKEDAGGNLWLKSALDGVYIYDRQHDMLRSDFGDAIEGLGVRTVDVVNLFVDQKKNLWLDTEGGLFMRNYEESRTETFFHAAKTRSVASDGVSSYVSLANGELWQVQPQEKLISDEKNKSFFQDQLYIDHSGKLWKYGIGLHFYDPATGQWSSVPENEITQNGIITNIIDDGNGSFWISSSENGLLRMNYDFTEQENIHHNRINEFSLPSDHIPSMFLSEDKTLWVGTAKKGASLLDMDHVKVERTHTDVSEDVGTIVCDQQGNILLGFDGKGLTEISGYSGKIIRYIEAMDNKNVVGSFAADDGRIYFCTYGDGVFCWDGMAVSRFAEGTPLEDKLSQSHFFVKDNNGNFWIATFDSGVHCLKADGSTLSFTNRDSELISNHISSMTFSKDDNIIYLSTNECLYEIICNTFELKVVRQFTSITNIYHDSSRTLWIGTTDGLFYINPKKSGEAHSITVGDGLSNQYIQGICSDRFDNLWVTTNHGFTNIFVYDTPGGDSLLVKCYPYYEKDGIGRGQFTKNTITCTADGRVLMGYDGDLISVIPEKYAPKLSGHPVELTRITVGGTDLESLRLYSLDPVKVKSHESLSIEVSSMDYRNLSKVMYEYCMDNSGNWRKMDSNMLGFDFLPSGRHTLAVRSVGSYQANDPVLVPIQVAPPFYFSVPAFILYFLLLSAAAYFIAVFIRTRNRQKIDRERLEMNEAKMQFFTNISHDLRTPLTMILTPLSRLIKENEGTPMEQDLVLMDRSAQTLLDELNQLLDFRKLDKSKLNYRPSYGDLCRFVSEVTSSFSTVFSDGSVNLMTDISDAPIMMDFDRDKVQRILHNLLSNAFKYNKKDGNIVVSLSREEDTAVLKVSDSGIGVSDASKPHIFERFYQDNSKGALSGNGIGLHIVQEYAKLHGGSVSVADNQPEGSVFTVRLPIRSTMRPAPSDVTGTPVEFTNRPKVLIVEDNEHFRSFLGRCLSEGYDVVEAGCGSEALEHLARYAIDIVISDVMMPGMDGFELCHEIKNDIRYSHIPVILLTAIQDKKMVLKGLQEGADEYISKPFDYEILDVKVKNLLANTRANREKWKDPGVDASDIAISRLDKELMTRLTETVERNMSNSEYSVEELSADLGISRSGLYKKLTFITGKSPIEFIRILRLKKGREILEQGETSVSQVAWSVGFSPKQFSKYFKDEFGCLPSEYISHRKQ